MLALFLISILIGLTESYCVCGLGLIYCKHDTSSLYVSSLPCYVRGRSTLMVEKSSRITDCQLWHNLKVTVFVEDKEQCQCLPFALNCDLSSSSSSTTTSPFSPTPTSPKTPSPPTYNTFQLLTVVCIAVVIVQVYLLITDGQSITFNILPVQSLSVQSGSVETEDGLNEVSELTIVTGYFDTTSFKKGPTGGIRNRSHYLNWMQVWKKINNSVIFYTNKLVYQDEFKKIRNIYGYPTRTIVENIGNGSDSNESVSFWSFSLVPNISRIFQRPNYPYDPPNTGYPMYSALTHAKFDIMERVILENPFKSKYFAWFDIGIFRIYPNDAPCFNIEVPPDFNESKIAMNEVRNFEPNKPIEAIIRALDFYWVGAGVMFGVKEIFLTFIDEIRLTMIKMLEIGWFANEQKTIHAMYSDQTLNVSPTVQIQSYRFEQWKRPKYCFPNSACKWFYLPFLMIHTENCTTNNTSI